MLSRISWQQISQTLRKCNRGAFTAIFCFLFAVSAFSSNASAATLVVDDDSACSGASFTTIQSAVTAANPGDTIQICSGTYPISSTINLNKAGLTLLGTGATRPVLQIPGSAGYGLSVNAANVTLDNLEIQKTDLVTNHNLIYVGGNNFTAQNNLIYGPNPGGTWSATGLVSRGFEVTGGLSGLLLKNNVIHTLRQPAYINSGTTGSILNNNVSGTRGWVIDGAKINFNGNTWGPPANQGADIALLPSVNPADYNLYALSVNNNNPMVSVQYSSATVVTPANLQGWNFFDESPSGGTGSGGFVAGPGTPPLGVGSATMTVNSTGRENLFNNNAPFLGTRFADITTLTYRSYQNTNAAAPDVAVSLQFPVDYDLTDSNTNYQGRLVFEPYQGAPAGTVQQNTWQTWDALAGRWWATRTDSTGSNGLCSQSSPCTRAQLLAAFPNLGIHSNPNHGGIILRLGGPISGGMTAYVDAFTFGVNNANTTYDFDPVRPTVTINQASGQADPTSTSPINFTVTFSEPVTGFTSSDVVLSGTANPTTAVVTGSGSTYNVAVSGMSGSGTVIASVVDNAANSTATNAPSTASTSSDNSVTYFTCNNVSVPASTSVTKNMQFTVPITVDNTTGRGILSYQFSLNYNPSVITHISVDTAGTLSSGWVVTTNVSSGTLTVNAFSTSPLSGSGTLLNLKFISTSGIGTTSNLNFSNFQFNEGVPCVNTTNGTVTIISGTISGRVTYANSTTIKPVPNTTLTGTGTGSAPTVTATTDSNGMYTMSGFGSGPYTVTPSKSNQVHEITNSDASLVAQQVAGLVSFTATQMIAADVSGNGVVTAFDAALIAQFVAGLPNPSSTGTWRFIPVNRSYPNVETNYTDQDYSAILMGEVTGNWNPAGPLAANQDTETAAARQAAEQPEQVVAVTAPLPKLAAPNSNFVVALNSSNTTGEGITGYQFDLLYDSTVIMPTTTPCDLAGTISYNLNAVCNSGTPGVLKVVVFGINPTVGSGILIKLNFKAIGTNGQTSPLTIRDFMFNEGQPQDVTTDGQVLISNAPTAASVNIGGRVMVMANRGLANARVYLTDGNGETRAATTNAFGNYQFADVNVGAAYTITVVSKKYTFLPRTVMITEDTDKLNFTAEP